MVFSVLSDALNLAHRLKEGAVFRNYLARRLGLVVPLALLALATSIACTAATVLYIGGTHSLLLLLAFFLIPVVLFGSLFVQAYVLLSWLEGRALAKAYPQRMRRPPLPAVPWLLAGLALGAPLFFFVLLAPELALPLIGLLIAAPVVYARLDS